MTTLKGKDYLTKIIEVCQIQQQTVKVSGKAPCKDEFKALMRVIQGWAEKEQKEKNS